MSLKLHLKLCDRVGISQYYVYVHFTSDTNTAFYVGKGKLGRAFDLYHRSKKHKNIVLKHGCIHKTLSDSYTYDESVVFEFETKTIIEYDTFYDYKKNRMGCNFTMGGDGMSGYRHRDESKAKTSASLKGHVVTEETRELLRVQSTGRKQSPETIEKRCQNLRGRPKPDGFGEKLSKARKGKPCPYSQATKDKLCKKVEQYTKDGEFVARYESMSEASKTTNTPIGNMSSCYGMRKSVNGFVWKFVV